MQTRSWTRGSKPRSQIVPLLRVRHELLEEVERRGILPPQIVEK
jgi:hypothetical protein